MYTHAMGCEFITPFKNFKRPWFRVIIIYAELARVTHVTSATHDDSFDTFVT